MSAIESQDPVTSNLSGLLSGPSKGDFLSPDHVAKYFANVTSSAKINQVLDVSERGIMYHIGRRGSVGEYLIADEDDRLRAIQANVKVGTLVASELSASAKRYNALAGQWHQMDMASVVEGLAKGLAHYRMHGVLTQEMMAGTDALSYIGVGSRTEQVAPSDKMVYIPSGVDNSSSRFAMAALVAAVTGAGGSVVSDLVGVEAGTDKALVPFAEGIELALGCYQGLVVLGENYHQHEAGEIFTFALTVGIHKVVTVHGHTDEGSITRDVLRNVNFAPPRGGIAVGLPSFDAMPKPTGGTDGLIKLVDSIALSTAGAVALCDPMVTLNGRKYPTVLSGSGPAPVATDEDARANMRAMAAAYPDFSRNLSIMWGRLIGSSGGTEDVVRILTGVVTRMSRATRAHMRYKVVAPFFWVEPTGVVECSTDGMVAQEEGLGVLCTRSSVGVLPAFRGFEQIGGNGFVSGWRADFRFARRHAMLHHLQLHAMDGLAHLRPRRVDVADTLLTGPGARGRADESLRDKVRNGRGMDEYLWGRGHSSIIAPAESINIDKDGIDFIAVHKSMTDNYISVRANHFPTVEEMAGTVEFRVTTLMPLGVSVRQQAPRTVRRHRRLAAQRLSAARVMKDYEADLDLVVPVRVLNDEDDHGDEDSESGSQGGGGGDEDYAYDLDPVERGSDVSETIQSEVREAAEAGLRPSQASSIEVAVAGASTTDGARIAPSLENRSTPAPRNPTSGPGTTQRAGKIAKAKKSSQPS